MKIVGQERLLTELNLLIQDMLKGKNYNILLRARSGYGKTSVALNLLWYLGWDKDGEYLIPKDGKIIINQNKRTHVIDEVHTLLEPEFLYPMLDSEKFIFILCTNESGKIAEPLRNRCLNFWFDEYTKDDIIKIIKIHLPNFPDNLVEILANRSKINPRECSVLCKRILYITRWLGKKINEEELNNILDNLLMINKDGLGPQDRSYLEFLERVGTSSLENISRVTGLDKETIRYEIEPLLLQLGKIKITSKGRSIIKE